MKVAFFDAHPFEKKIFEGVNDSFNHTLTFFDFRLTLDTAAAAAGYPAICAFVNDRLSSDILESLYSGGTRLVALRSAGFNHVDLAAAEKLGISVVRVPAYSPYAVAEHAAALILSLNRKTHRAYARVRELNFSLDGLVGFDLNGKTVGIVGTGKIGSVFIRIMAGFGCKILAHDPVEDPELVSKYQVKYVSLSELYSAADIISLHVPLTQKTRHLVDSNAFERMKTGVMLINTGRGALIDTRALITSLKCGKVGSAGLDVYEEEESIFFQDLSGTVLQDDVLARLLTFPNVLITSHQGFLTQEALVNITTTTLQSISEYENGQCLRNQVKPS